MLDLNDFRYFVRIIECGGFTAAGRNLNVPKSTVSHRLQQLEAGLGVRLVNRTSRSLSMTGAGEIFYRYAAETLERAEFAESAVRAQLTEPTGTIRFTTAVATSLYALRPILSNFIQRYPKINLVQHTSDEEVDIIGGSYDLAIRAHTAPLSDSTLVQRTLASAQWVLCAAPAYLDHRGSPLTPEDLADHDALIMLRPGHPTVWKLRHPTRAEVVVPLEPRMAGNDILMMKQAAQDGVGIVALPHYICSDQIRAGTLKRVLPDWLAGEANITAVIPSRHGLLPSVRAFIDFLAVEIPKVVV
jgi:DNA-binding transcriptional LysR family regulator